MAENNDNPSSPTLGWLLENYESLRVATDKSGGRRGHWRKQYRPICRQHMKTHRIVLRLWAAYFGERREIDSITPTEMEDWADAAFDGKLVHVRSLRTRNRTKKPTETTVRNYIRAGKAICGFLKASKFIESHPLEDFAAQPFRPEPKPYVSTEQVEQMCAATKVFEVALMFRLCRYAGLRKGEAVALPFADYWRDDQRRRRFCGIDWDQARICLVAPKTGHYREIPIAPMLYAQLSGACGGNQKKSEPIVGRSKRDWYRDGTKAIERAGLQRWPKLFQSLRSSCENDWKVAGVPEATYAAWLGHSIEVSRSNYTAPTDDEFALINQPHTQSEAGPGGSGASEVGSGDG
jgi:integrase